MDYIQCLNGENLYQSFISGAREVIKNKNALNDINVFPVADRDTGTNLASTMNYIIEESKIDKSARITMSSIADAALAGARGNSGIIMAQYINGMFMSLNEEEEITISGFAESIKNAFPHAYNSISDPVEGTMITVIREWAQAVYNNKDTSIDFYQLLGQPLEVAFKSLEETTSKLKVLQKSKVVDSGAKGFVHFIEGFTEFIKTGKLGEVSEVVEEIHSFHEIEDLDGNINHRYCTEGLLVMKAAELIHSGASLANIINEIKYLRDKTQILVSVNTLKYMVKSGRLSKVGGILGKIINLKPVVSLDEKGAGSIADMAFSIKGNTKKIMKRMKSYNEKDKITRYSIVHANDPVRAEEYRKKCLEILKFEPEYIMNISTIVGISAGVGSVAVAYMSERGDNNG